jgi:hypothetical protein
MKKYLVIILLFANFVVYTQTEFKKSTLVETHPLSWLFLSYNLGIEHQYATNQSFTFSIFRQIIYPGQFLIEFDDDQGYTKGSGYEARIGWKFFLTKLHEKTTRFYLEPQFRASRFIGKRIEENYPPTTWNVDATQLCLLAGFQKKYLKIPYSICISGLVAFIQLLKKSLEPVTFPMEGDI